MPQLVIIITFFLLCNKKRHVRLLQLLPARASEQGNVIGLVSVLYIYYVRSCHQKKIVIEQTRDLIYLKFVATDFFPVQAKTPVS